jgi:hypothetical protein
LKQYATAISFPFPFVFVPTREISRGKDKAWRKAKGAALLMEQENKGGLKIKLRLGGELIPREEPQPLHEDSKVFIPLEALQVPCNRHCTTALLYIARNAAINCFSSALPCVGRSGATQGDNQAEAPP